MKKIFFFLLFVLTKLCASAGPFDKKMLLGGTVSGEYSYRYLSSDTDLDWLVDIRNENEKPIPGFSAAFHFQTRVWRKLYADFSIAFVRKGYCTKRDSLIYAQQEPGAPVKLRYRYTTGCIELPVSLNFHPVDSNAFFISLGIAPVIPVVEGRKTFFEYADGSTQRKSDTFVGVGLIPSLSFALVILHL